MMKIVVVGDDPKLEVCCNEVLADLGAPDCQVISCPFGVEPPPADFYIWDFVPASFTPTLQPEIFARALFAVDSNDLASFRARTTPMRASIVLKPARPIALAPFLEHAIRRAMPSSGTVERKPESDVEALLDCCLNANVKLQEYEESRVNFLARTLHDFRAPLTALSGYCGLLIDQRIGVVNPDLVVLLTRMQHSITRLSRLADAMFEFSVGQRMKREPNLRPADVEATANQAIHEIGPYAQAKQIRLTVRLTPPERTLMFDSDKIEQVLINLLENACKFTPRGGAIELSGYPVFWNLGIAHTAMSECLPETSNAYRIDLRDSARRIPPERLNSIFEEFTSYSGAGDRSGAGLGLAICRMIVTAHRGRIWAESGKDGNRFSLILPHRDSGTPRVRVNREITRNTPSTLSA